MLGFASGLTFACALAGSPHVRAGVPESDPVLAREVDACLARARAALLAGKELSGPGAPGGRALAALALLRAGASPEEATLARALRSVLAGALEATSDSYGGTYHAGLLLVLLEELGEEASPVPVKGLAAALTRRLVELQGPSGGWGDISRTEFAAMGLGAAERLGVRLPPGLWPRLAGFVRARQLADGSWGYREGDPATGSMTAAALVALLCAGEGAGESTGAGGTSGSALGRTEGAGAGAGRGATGRGLDWLGRRFVADANPGEARPAGATGGARYRGARHRFYFLAGLASLARAMGSWPERSWAFEGAGALVEEQQADGRWRGDVQDCPTEFATIFLVETRRALWGEAAPQCITVGVYSPGWRAGRAGNWGQTPGTHTSAHEPALPRQGSPAGPRSRPGCLSPIPEGAGESLARALARWSDLRADIRFRQVRPGRERLERHGGGTAEGYPQQGAEADAPVAGLPHGRGVAFVVAFVDRPPDPSEADLAELSAFVKRGGTVVIEGSAGEASAEARAGGPDAGRDFLAALVSGRPAGRAAGTRGKAVRVRVLDPMDGPAPLGPGEGPRLEAAGAGGARVLLAPVGLFSLLGKDCPPESAVARAAVNVFVRAASR